MLMWLYQSYKFIQNVKKKEKSAVVFMKNNKYFSLMTYFWHDQNI